jgi:hypothetical protein
MTTKFYAIAGLFLLASGAPVLAGDTGSSGSQPTTKSDDSDPNKVVCHRIESIGTRLGAKRVCRTKGEWDAEQAAERQTLERTQIQRSGRDNG